MVNLATALRAETSRLVQAEVAKELKKLKTEIAGLKRALKASARGEPSPRRGSRRKPGAANVGRSASSARLTPASIRKHRQRLGLTQVELGELCGVTPIAVYFWESGRTTPKGKNVERLAGIPKMTLRQAERELA